MTAPTDSRSIRRLVGIYDATGTLRGEIAYLIRSRLGHAHCALCDITHGALREKSEWRRCRDGLPVPFDALHLNERDADLVRVSDGHTPCIIAATDAGYEMLLSPAELEACGGSPEHLVDAIDRAVVARGLSVFR